MKKGIVNNILAHGDWLQTVVSVAGPAQFPNPAVPPIQVLLRCLVPPPQDTEQELHTDQNPQPGE